MSLPGKWLENSEFISKQKGKGAETERISPGYPILKESRVASKEWKQTTRKPGRQSSYQAGEFPDTSQGAEKKPALVFKGRSDIPLKTSPQALPPLPSVPFCENISISLVIRFERIC